MLNKISKFLLFLAALTPIVLARGMFFPFISGKTLLFRLFVEGALLFFLLHILLSKERKQLWKNIKAKLKNPIVLSVLAFALLFVITGLLGDSPFNSFWSNFERGEGGFQMLHYFTFFALGVLLFQSKKGVKTILLGHVLASVLVCIYALLQFYAGSLDRAGKALGSLDSILSIGPRLSGTLGNPSYLSIYLLFTLVVLIYLFLQEKSLPNKISLGIIFVGEFLILLQSGTRGVFLGMFVGILIIILINFFIQKRKSLKIILLILFLIPIILATVFVKTPEAEIWSKIPVLGHRLNLEGVMVSLQPRLWTWGQGVSGVLEKPLLGWGSENFSIAFDKYYNPSHFGLESFFDRTHNIFLEYLISGGFVLLIPWLLIFFFYYKSLFRRKKDFWYSMLFTMPIMYLIQGFFLFDILPVYIALFVFLILFISTSDEKEVPMDTEYAISPVVMGGMIIIFIATATITYIGTYQPYRKNRLLVDAIRLEARMFRDPVNKPSVQEIRQAYVKAYEAPSPIGQVEVVNTFARFSSKLLDSLGRSSGLKLIPEAHAELIKILETNEAWFAKIADIAPGLKPAYISGGIYLRAGILASIAPEVREKYLIKGKEIYNNALEIAPTRIEFTDILLKIARLENDKEAEEVLDAKIKFLRPDLGLES